MQEIASKKLDVNFWGRSPRPTSGLIVLSRCLGHQPSELQVGKSPRFLRHFTEARLLFVFISRDSESRPSAVTTLSTKMAAPVKRFIFFVFVDIKCFYTLDYNATLFQLVTDFQRVAEAVVRGWLVSRNEVHQRRFIRVSHVWPY